MLDLIAHRSADGLFAVKRAVLGAHRARRTRLYCVGMDKTGTHSVAGLFSRNVRARHEPYALSLIQNILDWRAGRFSDDEMTVRIRARDRKLALEVDSSLLNFDILDILLREFPEARFVLTIRDCYSWLDSWINHAVRYKDDIHPLWIQTRAARFRPDLYRHAPEERALQEAGLFTLDGYFSNWTDHNRTVLARVPTDRLLVVRTDQIGARAFEIADFAGLPRRAVRPTRGHAFQNPVKQKFLHRLDRQFLERKATEHCGELMRRYFPEIRTPADAGV
jgi:hypothetical protein